MIYVVMLVLITPGWAWATLISVTWATFVYQTHKRIGFGRHVTVGLLGALTLQSITASSTAIATSQDSISAFACLMGIFGTLLYPIIILAEVAILVFLFKVWPQSNGKRKRGFSAWLSIWFILNLLAFLAHMRSASLCTV